VGKEAAVNPRDARQPVPEEVQVVSAVVVVDAPEAAACTLCGGPARLCGGARRCTGFVGSPLGLRWLTALRAVYAGLVLTRTVAAQWGGTLLRFGRRLAAGEAPPRTIADVAGEVANPWSASPGVLAAEHALAYLRDGDLKRLSDLSQGLRQDRAPWLVDLAELAPRAAVATPLDRERFALFAVLCDGCARRGLPLDALYENVGTYDDAIRCPRCGALPAHPLPGVRIGELHPVSRCVARTGDAERSCLTHPGGELDAEGLCVDGRATFDRALVEVSKIDRARTPFERDLVQAFVRARRLTLHARIDDAALARAVVTSPALMPFFAALAATHPEAAEDLAQIAGAPLDPDAADPTLRAAMSAGGGLAGLLVTGRAALESLFGTPRELASGRPPRRRQGHPPEGPKLTRPRPRRACGGEGVERKDGGRDVR
jgi:hypothetical protein